MKIYEQADASKAAPCGAIYSWILDGVGKRSGYFRMLSGAGWKFIGGRPGAFTTNDPDLAASTATRLNIDIVSNGTHAALGVPVLLCDPLAEAKEATPLARIKALVKANYAAGREPYAGLESSEIAEYNRAMMFGDNDEAFPDQATWSRIVD